MKSDPVIARHLKDLLEKIGFLRSQQGISVVELRKDLGTRLAIVPRHTTAGPLRRALPNRPVEPCRLTATAQRR